MSKAPLLICGLIFAFGGVLSLLAEPKPGYEWVPIAQIIFGLTLATIKLIWIFKHKGEL